MKVRGIVFAPIGKFVFVVVMGFQLWVCRVVIVCCCFGCLTLF